MNNVHYGVKKYKCDNFNCNKVFSNSSNLIAHKRIHSGEKPFVCKKEGCSAKFNQSSSLARHMKMKSHDNLNNKSVNKPEKVEAAPEKEKIVPKVPKKTPYIIPEILKDTPSDVTLSSVGVEPNISHSIQNISSCQQEVIQQPSYSMPQLQPQPQQSLLPEALNPMNLINNSSTSNYNSISSHSAPSFLPPLPHHETTPMPDHQIHHFSNFDNTTYLPPALPNSFNFIMGGLDFSKNSLNGEPTYIDY
jgi:hypothetical protein